MSDFDIGLPPFIIALKKILSKYTDGQILKELIQNAEDSNASVVKFFIDHAEYPSNNLMHTDLDKFQGPALLAYNDSQFTESDFKSIRNIERSEKSDKPLKIGKFGLGFNSIYHLTDFPSIISGKSLIFMDPHEIYLPRRRNAVRLNFEDTNHHEEYFKKCSDQFLPYLNKNLSEKKDEIDFKKEFEGTLFRFPIRKKTSELSDQVKPFQKLIYDEILEPFFKDMRLTLLFLRYIERIEVYEIINHKNKLIGSTFIDYEASSSGLKQNRDEIRSRLNQCVDPTDRKMNSNAFNVNDLINNFKMVIKTIVLDKSTGLMNESIDKYIISNHIRLKSASKELKELALKTATFPICGLAYKINKNHNNYQNLNEKFKSMRYFCFLPLPETIEKTGLPFHLNGSFGLRDDRRDLRWLANDTMQDESAKWNGVLINEVLTYVLEQFLNFARNLIENNDSDLKLIEFYHLLPNLKSLSLNWKEKNLKSYLSRLKNLDLIYCQDKKWRNLECVFLVNNIERELEDYSIRNKNMNIEALKKLIYETFSKTSQLAYDVVPSHVIELSRELNMNLKYIESQFICQTLKLNPILMTNEQKVELLNFLIQTVPDCSLLIGLDLVPCLDLQWKNFSGFKIYFIQNKNELDLFSCGSDSILFDDSKLNINSRKIFLNWLNESNIGSVSLFKSKNSIDFICLLTRSLEAAKWQSSFDSKWLNDIWDYINKHYEEPSLIGLENLNLLSKKHKTTGLLEFFSLRAKNKQKYFYLKPSDDEISSEFIEFLELNINEIIIFNDMPQSFLNHPQRNNYVNDISLSNFNIIFKHLYSCLNKELYKVISEKMSANCKFSLLENLNSVKKASFDMDFVKIILDFLPIFNCFNQGKTFTAKQCNYYMVPVAFAAHLAKLNLNPDILMLDTILFKKLSANLSPLKEYPLERLIIESIEYNIQRQDKYSVKELFKFYLLNFDPNSVLISQRPIFMDKENNWLKLNQYYEPNDKFVQLMVPEDFLLPADLSIEPYYSKIKNRLLKNIELKYFIKFIQTINAQTLNKRELIKIVFDLISIQSNKEELLQSTLNFEWLTSLKDSAKLYKSSQLWSADFKDLVELVEPLVDNHLIPTVFHNILKIKTDLNPELVFRNYSLMISSSTFNLTKMTKHYDYFLACISSQLLVQKFEEKKYENFIYTFESFLSYKPASCLVLDFPNGCSLSPYLYSLNKSQNEYISKFEKLYLNVFKVLPKVTLEKLIEILEKIKTEPHSKRSFIMVRNILETIKSTHLSELLDNQTLMNRLLLPVQIDSSESEKFDLEVCNKCVYSVEDGNSVVDQHKIDACHEKELKLVDSRFTDVKFLKQIDVKSFTQTVMNIENLVIENYGQTEELTERIRKLLDGYKDGLSIFKEAIQNADDSGANIFKICFDKRKNKQSRNEFKLLDKNMANAQGPALLFYNDSIFSENDFKALIKLGSGSKKDSKEKIGKFGLGFNSVYNITDVPSIVSSNSLVIFDPNLKYLTNILKNTSQPGIRLNLHQTKGNDLISYYDQFKPYENIFGCNIFEKNFNYNGTLMRLPLRNEPSCLSSKIYDDQTEIASLLKILLQNIDTLLLFTQTVKEIQVYVLEDNMAATDMKLLLDYKISPVEYIQKHEIVLKTISTEFKQQTSILKAASENLNSEKSVETAMIVKSSTKLDEVYFKKDFECNDISILSFQKESYWMIVSSVKKNYSPSPELENMMPCVSMATEVIKIPSKITFFRLKVNNSQNSLAFCFLPLPIETNLNFHINGNFFLSDDRLHLNESSKVDKVSYKHVWNEYLLDHLINNLFRVIDFVTDSLIFEKVLPHQLVEQFWPINNKIKYFAKFEERFYERIIAESDLSVFPAIHHPENFRLTKFKESKFVDFNLDFIQDQAIQIACKILQKDNLSLVNLEPCYLIKLKSKLPNKNCLIDEYIFLKILIKNKYSIDFNEYEKLIIYFLKESKITGDSDINILMKSTECIPTVMKSFKSVRSLINPKASQYYLNLFEKTCDLFPSENICNDQRVMDSLVRFGMINKILPLDTIIEIAMRVKYFLDMESLIESRELSKNLISYLSTLEISSEGLKNITNQLKEIKWIFAKHKPLKWLLPWCSQDNMLYKPDELFDEHYEKLVGCVRPISESSYEFKKLFSLITSSPESIIEDCFEQLNLLITNNAKFKLSEQIIQTEESMIEFYLFLQRYTTENPTISKQEKEKRIMSIKSKLPAKWIYVRENKYENFMSIDSIAFKVYNTFEPELVKIPSIYTMNHHFAHFFKCCGVPDYFTLESLKLKLKNIKDLSNQQPLDEFQLELCQKITDEMTKISCFYPLKFNLGQLKNDPSFYLPDIDRIMRETSRMCLNFNNASLEFIKANNFFVLHPMIRHWYFGIENLEKKLLSKYGIPFGQKENLVKRINDILRRYESKTCIFKEFIQNADDAKATKISFFLDKRPLNDKKTFGKDFNSLQNLPALCVWNNSKFNEHDFEGIISLGEGSKQHEIEKTGRFGVGFNSIYHITDCPMFISNNESFVIFDPLCTHFPGISSQNPGFRMPNIQQTMSGVYDDVLSGFDFGVNSEGEMIADLNESTMFRFPIRSSKSLIEGGKHTFNDIEKMIEDYTRNQDSHLFLKNLEEISFFIIENDQNGHIKTKCIQRELLKYERRIDSQKRKEFRDKLARDYDSNLDEIKPNINDFTLSIEISSDSKKVKKRQYLLFEQYGFDCTFMEAEKLKSMQSSKKELNISKYFPMGAIAFQLDIFEKRSNNYQIYNFLPLDHERSPLGCHINAYWALSKENRTELYRFAEENMGRDVAIWHSEWNYSIINAVILPCYLRLFKQLKEKFSKIEINEKEFFLDNIQNLFPEVSSKNDFKDMLKNFYLQIEHIECIPIIQNSNKIKWYKPGDVYFTKNFEKKIDYLIRKIDPSKSKNVTCDQICEILFKSGIRLCRLQKIYDKIEGSKIKLNQLDGAVIIKKLKDSEEIIEVDLKESIYKRFENVEIILELCTTEVDLSSTNYDGCPLLVSNDNIVRKFTSDKIEQLFYYKYAELFMDMQHKFLHKSLFRFFPIKSQKDFFKTITISDLNLLLPTTLKKNVFCDENNSTPILRANEIKKFSKIWKIILGNIDILSSSKKEKISSLDPIKNWCLIPVNSKNKDETRLYPISKCQNIICEADMIKDFCFLNLCGYPSIKLKVFSKKDEIDKFFLSITNNLAKPVDVLDILVNTLNRRTLSLTTQNRSKIKDYLQRSLKQRNYNKKMHVYNYSFENEGINASEEEIKSKIKSLPIFESILDTVENISNKLVYMIEDDLDNLKNDKDGIRLFCEQQSCFIIKQDYQSLAVLYNYLGVENLKLEGFYAKFLTCASKLTQIKFLDNHFSSIKNMHLTDDLIIPLSKCRFVCIDGTYRLVSECFSRKDELFKLIFGDFILPDEYSSTKNWESWKELMCKLGLKQNLNVQECLYAAKKLKEFYGSNQINFIALDECVRKLFIEISLLLYDDKNLILLDELKEIKFIPDHFKYKKDSINCKIYNPSTYHDDLVCMKGSYFSEWKDFVWTTHRVLPSFVREALVCSEKNNSNKFYKLAQINYDVNSPLNKFNLVENFKRIIEIIKKNNFLNNSTLDIKKINKMLCNNFEKMQELFITNKEENLNELMKLENLEFVVTRNYSNNKYQFVSIKTCVNKLKPYDRIEGFIECFPDHLSNYVKLMRMFGLKEKVNFEMCQSFLENLYINTQNSKLNENQYREVMKVYKMLFLYDLLNSNQSSINESSINNSTINIDLDLKLYAPNKLKVMKELSSLYYIDMRCYEDFIEENQDLKEICLFDFDDVKKLFLDPNLYDSFSIDVEMVSDNQRNFLSKMLLNVYCWPQLINIVWPNNEASDASNAPNAFSKIIVSKTCQTSTVTEDHELNNKLHSIQFALAVIKVIQALDKGKKITVDIEIIKDVLNKISCWLTSDIKAYFFNSISNKKVEHSECELNVFPMKNPQTNELKFFCSNNCCDKHSKNFKLSESILDLLITNKQDDCSQLLREQNHRFIHLIEKLLMNPEKDYEHIIRNYERNSLF